MYSQLKNLFFENIIIQYKAYLNQRKKSSLGYSEDLKAAINLATALYHIREHLPTNTRKTKAELSVICPDYNLLADVVNASKHGTLTRGVIQLSSAKNIYEIVVLTTYKDKLGEYNHIQKSIELKLDSGPTRDLHEVIINVLNMWITEFKRLNIIDNYPAIARPSTQVFRRTKNSGVLNMSVAKDLSHTAQIRFQKYNYETRTIEPVDLTGSDFKLNVYKPMFTISLKFSKDGHETGLEVDIDAKEKRRFEKMTEQEKVKFIIGKGIEQGKLKSHGS